MSNKQELWDLALETMQAFAPFYREAMNKAIQDTGAPNEWFFLYLARASDPAPLTVERLRELGPYGAVEPIVERVESLVKLDLLERVGEDAYRLTGPGREAIENVFESAHQGLDAIEPLPAEEMDQLNSLLRRIVEATLESPEPAEKWAMVSSRWTDPGEDAPGAAKADQYLTDLARYRDDAHIGAWKPHDVSGHAWEALTFVWRGDASTAEELAERLPFRGYTAQDYQGALQDLVARGWVVEEAGAYKLTGKGTQVREKAEAETDRYFFIGWSALSEAELTQFQDLLARARERMQAVVLEQMWDLARAVGQAIYPVTRETVDPMFEKHGLGQPGYYFGLLAALTWEPDPLSTVHLGKRDPYGNLAQLDNLLTALAEEGLLNSRGGGEYVLAKKGRAGLEECNHAFYTRLAEIEALPAEDMAQLEDMLKRVVEACLAAPELLGNGGITKLHRVHPTQEYGPLARIDQHIDDLHAFRVDAHLAAWRSYDVGGHAWEALTFVWRGEASTAEELAEKLSTQGHAAPIYAGALANLARRGWVAETSDSYQITEKGRAVRQQAEDATNRYFFAPWACLEAGEKIQLHWLLTQLRNNLRDMAEENADTA